MVDVPAHLTTVGLFLATPLTKMLARQLLRWTLWRSSFNGFFALFPSPKQSAKVASQSSAELVSHSRPPTSTTFARSKQFTYRGEVWYETVDLKTGVPYYWRPTDSSAQWNPPWE